MQLCLVNTHFEGCRMVTRNQFYNKTACHTFGAFLALHRRRNVRLGEFDILQTNWRYERVSGWKNQAFMRKKKSENVSDRTQINQHFDGWTKMSDNKGPSSTTTAGWQAFSLCVCVFGCLQGTQNIKGSRSAMLRHTCINTIICLIS